MGRRALPAVHASQQRVAGVSTPLSRAAITSGPMHCVRVNATVLLPVGSNTAAVGRQSRSSEAFSASDQGT
jgi:hypothetical protein